MKTFEEWWESRRSTWKGHHDKIIELEKQVAQTAWHAALRCMADSLLVSISD